MVTEIDLVEGKFRGCSCAVPLANSIVSLPIALELSIARTDPNGAYDSRLVVSPGTSKQATPRWVDSLLFGLELQVESYLRLLFVDTSFRVFCLVVLSIPARVTITFGATNHFSCLPSRSRVTKILAQFA